jgi:hypothetical protein
MSDDCGVRNEEVAPDLSGVPRPRIILVLFLLLLLQREKLGS